ncbi:MAG: hypothetical protein KF767_17800 [Bdellovibrionaceae bacterium]|nr:hypothetical protein [Pseudobdellovibrionaceae bacterium]
MLEASMDFIWSYGPALLIALAVWPLPFLNTPNRDMNLQPPAIKRKAEPCRNCPQN